MSAEEIIKTLGAVGVAVAAYWFGLAAAIAPPDHDSMAFFTIACSVAGLILGGTMMAFRSRIAGRWIAGLILTATLVGGGALFRYEHHRQQRTAPVSDVGDATRRAVVTDILSPSGFVAVIGTETCSEQEVVSAARRQVTFACARRAVDEISAADRYLFDDEARRRSSGLLIGWYRLAAASLMLALFLLVDFFLARVPSRVAAAGGAANHSP